MFEPFAVALLLAVPVVATAAEAGQPPPIKASPSRSTGLGSWRWGVVLVQLRDKSVCGRCRSARRITSRLVNALERIHRRSRFKQIRVAVAPPAPDEPPASPGWSSRGAPFKVTYQDAVAAKRPAAELLRTTRTRCAGVFAVSTPHSRVERGEWWFPPLAPLCTNREGRGGAALAPAAPRRSSPAAQRLDLARQQRRSQAVAHEPEVGHLEDRRVRVFIDGDDGVGEDIPPGCTPR